jgi:hypothetical protein
MILKGDKKDFLSLLVVLNKTPSSKMAAEAAKYSSFRKNLRKAVNDVIEKEIKSSKEYGAKIKEIQTSALELNKKVGDLRAKPLLSEEDKQEIENTERMLAGMGVQVAVLQNEMTRDRNALYEECDGVEIEVKFNIEDLDYIKKLLSDNATVFFSYKREENGEDFFDDDSYLKIMDLLASEVVPANS